MADRHTVLLIEDDPSWARSVSELLSVLGYDVVHLTSFSEARAGIEEGVRFCFVVMDLQILPTPESIKPHVEAGFETIRELRARFPRRGDGGAHLLPIIVMSGHAKDHHFTRAAFLAGADDFIVKPFDDNRVTLPDTIRQCLERSGRTAHAQCDHLTRDAMRTASTTPPPVVAVTTTTVREPATAGITIDVTGKTNGNRSEILVDGVSVELPTQAFVVLVGVIDGRVRDVEWVEKEALGARAGEGLRGASLLQTEMKRHLPAGLTLVENNRGGGYRLHASVGVGTVDTTALGAHGDDRVRKLAASIASARKRRAKTGS